MANVIKGQHLRVFVGGAVVAEATSCQITVSGNYESSSTKDDDYEKQSVTTRSWSVSVDTFSEEEFSALLDIILAMAPVTLKWDQTSGSGNATAESAAFSYSGQAYLSDLSATMPNRSNMTVTAQFTGKGGIS